MGFVVSLAIEYYYCLQYYFPQKRLQRPVDTVAFFLSIVPIPQVSLEDLLRQAAMDIITLLQDPPSTTTLSLQVRGETCNTLLDLATILQRTEKLSTIQEKLPDQTATPQRI